MVGNVILGAVLGGVAVWIWRNDIESYVQQMERNSSGLRSKVADTMQSVQDTAETVLDRTKQRVTSGLETGRDVIRPSGDASR